MDIRAITDTYFVAPQIDAEDILALKAQGIEAIICNRPDEEVPPSHQAQAIGAAATAAGIAFHILPLTHQTFTPQRVSDQRAICDAAPGKVLAYCASGTRSTIAWALGQAGDLDVDEILQSARAAGYDLENMRATLQATAAVNRAP